MRVLVTGGAGYIGDAVVEELLIDGHDVTVVDNLTYTDSYMRPGVTFYNLDVTDAYFWDYMNTTEPFDAIIHLAALVGDGACAANPEKTELLNEKVVMWFSQWVKKKNPSCRFIFTSTCSVYGDNNELLNEESQTKPLSLYAGTKLNAEKYVGELDNSVIFRLGTLFGVSAPFGRIRADLVANILTFKATMGEKLTVFGGEQWRPLLHVRDVGRSVALAVLENFVGTYILSNKNYTILELANIIIENVQPTCGINITDMKFEDLRNYKVDNSKYLQVGVKPGISLKKGVKELEELLLHGRIKNPWISKYHNAKFIKESMGV